MTLRRTILFSMALGVAGILSGRPADAQTKAARASVHRPVLMISIDGLRPDAVLQADKYGLEIPVLRRFLVEGAYAQEVVNVNPTVTNPNHTTLVTGVLPREHGIYNNRPFAASVKLPASYGLYPQIKAPTLWGSAKAAGLTTGSLYWPITAQAADIDFNIGGGSEDDDAKIATDAAALIAQQHPDLLTVHFVSLDHQEHQFGPFSPEANAALERIDAAIGRVVAAERAAYPDAVVAVVSDHGFSKIARQININTALVEAGFITLTDGPDKTVASWTGFGWYVGGSGMVVLRDLKDQQTKTRLKAYLHTLAADPENGIERVYARDEIAALGLAPEAEFVVAFKPGYVMGPALTGPLRVNVSGGAHGAFSTPTVRPDMHSSFFIAGRGIAAGKNLGVIDMRRIAPTVAGILKVSLSSAKMAPLPVGGR